jgi:hypothetical protein
LLSLRPHTAGRYFARERMLSHFSGFSDANLALDSACYRPLEEALLTEYRKAIPALTISEDVQTKSLAKSARGH